MIFAIKATEVVLAENQVRQRRAEMLFLRVMSKVTTHFVRKGVDKKRVARILQLMATAMATAGDR